MGRKKRDKAPPVEGASSQPGGLREDQAKPSQPGWLGPPAEERGYPT